jgi:hypothetical protein
VRTLLVIIAILMLVFPAPTVRAQQSDDSPAKSELGEIEDELDLLGLPSLEVLDPAVLNDSLVFESNDVAPTPTPVQHSYAELDAGASSWVRTIPSHVNESHTHRLVRYDVPLEDGQAHREFILRGIEGRLIKVPSKDRADRSLDARLKRFFYPSAAREKQNTVRVVRYEVPADDIAFHSQMVALDAEILEPGMLRLPEVRFFQPKARIYSDLKRDNDDEFDLFADGAILASLDVVELYFPMPLISERFAEAFGKSSRLSSIGWRVGGTVGLGITTALNNGGTDNGSAPVSTLSAGVRYEFPLGRPSREVLDSGDARLDTRTRVGIEGGVQGGFSTRESLEDRTDVGLYFGILVNTPWGG